MSPPKPIPAQQFQHIAAVTQEPHASQQAPTATPHVTTPRLSLEAQEDLAEYHNVRATISAYEAMSERDWKRSPVSPGTILTPLWQKLEEAKRRCLLLGVDPQCDRR